MEEPPPRVDPDDMAARSRCQKGLHHNVSKSWIRPLFLLWDAKNRAAAMFLPILAETQARVVFAFS